MACDEIKTHLLFHSSVSAGATEVIANDGIVTLRGDAASQAQKDLTTEYAKYVDDSRRPAATRHFDGRRSE